jgi:hypothetical protein
MDANKWERGNARVDTMSAFENKMKKLKNELSPEAREIVMKVTIDEHRHRFSDRHLLPEEYATAALQAAKRKEAAT